MNPFMEVEETAPPAEKNANPFMELPQQAAEQAPSVPSSFMDKVDIFNRGFERYALGGLQMLNNIPVVGRALPTDEQLAAQNAKSEANYRQAYARTPSPVVDTLGQIGGAITASAPAAMATTMAGPMGGLGATLQGAATGGMAGLVDYSENTSDRIAKGVTGTLMGGALGGAFYAGGALMENIIPKIGASSFVKKMLSPKEAAVDDIASAIKNDYAGNIPRALDDISRAPVGATPGEAMGRGAGQAGVLRRMESGIPVSPESKQVISDSIIPRAEEAKKSIFEAIGRMGTPKVKQTKAEAFAAMADDFISPDGSLVKGAPASTNYVPEFVKSNPTLASKYTEVANAKSEAYSSLPNNSVAKLHKVEESIKMDLYNAKPNPRTGAIAKILAPDEQQALIEAKNIIRPVLEQSESFNKAMAATSSLKKHDYYQELLKTKKADAGSNGRLSLDQVFDAVIPQKMRQQQFIKDVISTGGEPETVVKLVDLADSLRKAPLWEVLKGGNKSSATTLGGKSLGAVQQIVSNLTLDRYYKAMLEVTLSGDKWKSEIAQVLKASAGQEQQVGFLDLLKKASSKLYHSSIPAAATSVGRTVAGD